MQKFEYMFVNCGPIACSIIRANGSVEVRKRSLLNAGTTAVAVIALLNEFGNEGWEAIIAEEHGTILKRPKE